jgi:hypothetical protein
MSVSAAHGAPLLPTEPDRRRTPDSLRQRVFEPVVDHARQLRAERGHPVLPRAITPHTMRRTFISLWLEADPPAPIPWLMAQVGHAKPDTLLRIYAQVMQRDRAKIGSAFDALMAGAALPAETAIGQWGQTRPRPRQRTRPRVNKKRSFQGLR